MSKTKTELRNHVWNALADSGDSLFPGAHGRIPNFTGREKAADNLSQHPAFKKATTIKINPDSPQTPVRENALRRGKTLYMAVPKLKERKCFLELDPERMDGDPSDWSTIKGASKHGSPIHPRNMPEIDLIVTGAVAVDGNGRRLGKGGGYSDIEFSLLLEFERITPTIPIFTTVHPIQELDLGQIPDEPQDLTLSGYFLPDHSVQNEEILNRPDGIDREKLTSDQIESIPVLQDVPSYSQ